MARRAWLIWLPLGTLAVCAAGGWMVWSRSDLARYAGKLDAEVARASKAGVAVTATDLHQRTNLPDRDNAAGYYTKAFAELKSSGAEKVFNKLRSDLNKAPSPSLVGQAQTAARQHDAVLDAFVAASRRKGVDFKRPWEQGPSVLFPEFASFKSGAGALLVRAEVSSREGRALEALDDVEAAVRIAKHSGTDPALISKLVQTAIYRMALVRLEKVVNRDPRKPVLDRADEILDAMTLPDYRPCIDGEMVMMRVAMKMIARDPQMGNLFSSLSGATGVPADMRLLRLASVRRAMESKVVEELTNLYTALPENSENYQQTRKAMHEMDVRMQAQDLPTRLAGVLMPVYGQAGDSVVSLAAQRGVARAAIQVLRMPEIPAKLPFKTIDPFNQSPLIYKKQGSGFLLYSVDRDLKDNGGIRSGGDSSQPRDIVWQFP
jgi:hypothetical protein